MRTRVFMLAAGLALVVPTPAPAQLPCNPGVKDTTYVHATYLLPAVNVHQLRGELESWSMEQGLTGGGSSFLDRKTGIQTWVINLHPRSGGLVATVTFTSKAKVAEVAVENVCWEKPQDWRPLWNKVNRELLRRGYRRK